MRYAPLFFVILVACTPAEVPVPDLLPVPGARFALLDPASIVPNPRQPRAVFDEDALAELVFSILAVVCAPLIVDLYTPDNYPANEYDLAVAFARLCLPQVLFYGIYTMLSQVLNARGHFGAPMFAPIANNIVAIATYSPSMNRR